MKFAECLRQRLHIVTLTFLVPEISSLGISENVFPYISFIIRNN